MPLRVVEGASKFIEGASLYKTFTTGHSPVGKPYNRPAGEEMHPFWWLAPPPSPRWGDFILRYALSDEARLRGVLFCPCIGGSPVQPDKGEASAASQSAECISSYMIHNDNPVTLTL